MRSLVLPVMILLFLFNSPALAENSGHWKVAPPVPTARTEVAVAQLEGKIYVAGGFTPKGVTDKVDVFDTATGQWSQAAPLPQPLHHTAMVAHQGKLYVIGGFSGGMWSPLNANYEYDPAKNKWSAKAPMPTARGALTAAVIDGKIYAVGGARKSFIRLVNTDANEAYDPATNKWTRRKPIPTSRDHITASVVDGVMYVIGGRINVNYNRNLDVNEAYDPASNSWTEKSPLPTARSGITSQVINGKIFVFGGESGEGTFDQNEAYDAKTDSWKTMKKMPKACHGLGSTVIDGNIHLLNGGPHPGGGGSRFHQVFSLKPFE